MTQTRSGPGVWGEVPVKDISGLGSLEAPPMFSPLLLGLEDQWVGQEGTAWEPGTLSCLWRSMSSFRAAVTAATVQWGLTVESVSPMPALPSSTFSAGSSAGGTGHHEVQPCSAREEVPGRRTST